MGKATLVVMAAGMGSRFGGGIKQLEPVGPNGELIIDYSVYDAIEAGFDKVVFVIRKDLKNDFVEVIGNRISKKIEVHYAFQEIEDVPEKYQEKARIRKKPWGTGQAVLTCKELVKEPFLVINADDYYGKEAYRKAFQELTTLDEEKCENHISMVAYVLEKTLSENGTVTRGICSVDENNWLKDVVETYEIRKDTHQAVGVRQGTEIELPLDTPVSMNVWGLNPTFFDVLEQGFESFLDKWEDGAASNEYLLPILIGDLLEKEKIMVKVLRSQSEWFGVTYKEDKEGVVASLNRLIDEGVYPEKLY